MAYETLVLFLLSLCAWRMSYAVSHEKIFKGFRHWLGENVESIHIEKVGDETVITTDWVSFPDNYINNLIHCVKCLSVWMAGVSIVMWLIFPPLVLVFAISALAILVDNILSFLEASHGV